MKVCFTPHKSMRNQYINLFTESLAENGLKTYGLKEVLTNLKKYRETKIFHFNWFLKLNSKNKFVNILEHTFKFLLLFTLKITGKKIVYTLHNKLPHDAKKNMVVKILNKFLLKCSDRIIIHCLDDSLEVLREVLTEREVQNKVRYIEHGNYIEVYPEKSSQELRNKLEIKEDEKVFLFLGAVEPYKNTEMLIKAFNDLKLEGITLVIAGNPKTEDYRKKIESISESSNVHLELRFIEDDELSSFLDISDLLILPYNNKSSLNSGSIFLAFSYKKTVLSSNIGTLKDIKTDFYYSYDYMNEEDHLEKLKLQMLEIKNDLEEDPEILSKKGRAAYEYVKINNSWGDISKKVEKVYKELELNG